MVKDTPGAAAGPDPAGGWSRGLRVEVGGRGMIAQAGVILPRLLADRIGLTAGLRAVMARRGFTPGRDRGRLLADTAAALIAGASCVSDVEGLTRQRDLYGPSGGASDSTLLRALTELAGRIGDDGLPDARLGRMLGQVRAHAWAQITAARSDGMVPVVHVAGRPLTRPAAQAGGVWEA